MVDNLLVRHLGDVHLAGAHRLAAQMHGAGATQAAAAAELGAGQSQFVADHPEQGYVGVAVIGVVLSVHLEC